MCYALFTYASCIYVCVYIYFVLHLIATYTYSYKQIMESDPMGLAFITPAIVAQSFHPLSLYLGATFNAPPLDVLLGATADDLLSLQSSFLAQAAAKGDLQPIGMYATLNGVIPQQPQVAFEAGQIVSKVPLLIGTNRDEGITFTLKLFTTPLDANGYIAALTGLFGPTAAQIIGRDA